MKKIDTLFRVRKDYKNSRCLALDCYILMTYKRNTQLPPKEDEIMGPKAMIIIFTILSLQIAANPSDLSWGRLVQLKATGEVSFEFPEYKFNEGFFFSINSVCLGGDEKNVLTPIKIKTYKKCVRHHGKECKREITIHPSLKIEGERYGCEKWQYFENRPECQKWGKVAFRLGTQFNIKIKVNGNDQDIFTKTYSVPLCQDVE